MGLSKNAATLVVSEAVRHQKPRGRFGARGRGVGAFSSAGWVPAAHAVR